MKKYTLFTLVFLLLGFSVSKADGQQQVGLPGKAIFSAVAGNTAGEVMVLIHGNGNDVSSFYSVANLLGQKFSLLAYDQRGHGKTRYSGSDYSVPAMVADLENLLASKGITKAHLLGHSFGARIAVAFAAKNPLKVKSLILEDMEFIARQPVSDQQCLATGDYLRSLLKEYASVKEIQNTLTPIFGQATWIWTQVETKTLPNGHILLVKYPYPPLVWGCFANAADLSADLKGFLGPVLVMRADPQFSALSALGLSRIQQDRPDAKLVSFPGSHHFIHAFDPNGFSQTVLDFLQQQ